MSIDDIESRHDRLQLFIFAGVALGSTAFALQELVDMLDGSDAVYVALTVVALLGWLTACWGMYSTTQLVKDKGIERILNDERFARNRSSAFEFGFAAVLIVQIALMVGHDVLRKFADIAVTVGFATNLSIAVALIASLGRFVYLNR